MVGIAEVLQVIRPVTGGMLGHVALLLEGLDTARFQLTVACPPEERLLRCLKRAGVSRIFPLDVGDGIRPFTDLYVTWQLCRLLCRHCFSLIHAHGAKAGLVARLAVAAATRVCPPGPRVVLSLHNEIFPSTRSQRMHKWRHFMERRLLPYTTHFIAVSPSIAAELINEIGCPPQRVSIIPNGISLEDIGCSAGYISTVGRWGWGPEAFVVAVVARLTAEKGIDILLAALPRVLSRAPQLRVVIAGDGPKAKELQEETARRGLTGYVKFLGFQKDIFGLLFRCDGFVLPSFTDAWPLSLMEAMAAGLPVVASRVGGIPAMVKEGETGLLVDPGDIGQLAAALVQLATNRDAARKLGEEAAKWARKQFDARYMITRIQAVYEQVLSAETAQGLTACQ